MKGAARIASLVGVGLAVLVVAAGAFLWVSDYGLEATVTEKRCGIGQAGSAVTVRTKLLGLDYTVRDLGSAECNAVSTGNYVVYHIRTGATYIYEREGGRCFYPVGCS